MDAWSEAGTTGQHAIYTGVWTNWSHGRILGSTLTLTQRDGNLLIAFAAFFITLVATRVWKTICFFCHRCFSTSTSQDTLHHQRQVMLRNSASPQSGLWNFLELAWLSRKTQRNYIYRTLPLMLLAVVCLGVFAIATYFIPSISSPLGDEVLLRPGYCGLFDGPSAITKNQTEYDSIVLPYMTGRIADSANYAQQCYSDSVSSRNLDCTGFVTDRLPSTVNYHADCPFPSDICRSNTTNLFISTGLIDSNDKLGVNSPPDERILFGLSLHCSPLTTEGHTSTRQSTNENFVQYHYGSIPSVITSNVNKSTTEATFEIEPVETQYRLDEEHIKGFIVPWTSYQLNAFQAEFRNGSLRGGSNFLPTEKIRRYDADIYLVFLSGNGVLFSEPASDDWYRATRALYTLTETSLNESYPELFYGFEDAASPLACVQQFQFCLTSLPENDRCGPTASLSDAFHGALSMATSNQTIAQLFWVTEQIVFTRILDPIRSLGPQSLTSQRGIDQNTQAPIKANQWQLDVIHWWATYLAQIQLLFVNNVVGPTDSRLHKYMDTTLLSDEFIDTFQGICQNQKIRNSAYMNFSMFGTCFLFAAGGLIICISFGIEPMFSYLYKKWKYNEYAYLEWVTNSSLQLHRIAQEELGWGTWSGATNDVPTTQKGEHLGCLDLEKSNHPRLCRPPIATEADTKNTSSNGNVETTENVEQQTGQSMETSSTADLTATGNMETSPTIEQRADENVSRFADSDSGTVAESLARHDSAPRDESFRRTASLQ